MNQSESEWMWYGKLPGIGDFAHRRMDDSTLSVLDNWLQQRLQHLSAEYPDTWQEKYLAAPTWRFILGQGSLGESFTGLIAGVIMPSVDRVGRYFPLTLVRDMQACCTNNQFDFLRVDSTLARVEQTALDALDQDWDAETLDQNLKLSFPTNQAGETLNQIFDRLAQPMEKFQEQSFILDTPVSLLAPIFPRQFVVATGNGLWYRAPQTEGISNSPDLFISSGLPDDLAFRKMLGFDSNLPGSTFDVSELFS